MFQYNLFRPCFLVVLLPEKGFPGEILQFPRPKSSKRNNQSVWLFPLTRANLTSLNWTTTIYLLQSHCSLLKFYSPTFFCVLQLVHQLPATFRISLLFTASLLWHNPTFPTSVLPQCSELKVNLQILHKAKRERNRITFGSSQNGDNTTAVTIAFVVVQLQLCYRWYSLEDSVYNQNIW